MGVVTRTPGCEPAGMPQLGDQKIVRQSAGLLWPELDEVRAQGCERQERGSFIGGSDANIILSASPEKIVRLWRQKRGEEPEEDLSNSLPVMLGCWTETFNRQWYVRCTEQIVCRTGDFVRSCVHPWRACTLDGVVAETGAVWEAKHTSAFAKPDEVLARYMPQLQHNMAVTGASRAVLSVIFGNHKWEVFEVAADWLYQQDLLEAEERFWGCVQSGRSPEAVPPPPPPKAVGVREVCLDRNNAWAAAAADWLEHREAARIHAAACTSIKSMVEGDVSRAFGHGIEAKRSKSGAITIKELAL